MGAPGAHRGDPPAPRAPARTADQGRNAGMAGDGRTEAGADRDRQRHDEQVHDRGQRDARLRAAEAGRTGLPAHGQPWLAACSVIMMAPYACALVMPSSTATASAAA